MKKIFNTFIKFYVFYGKLFLVYSICFFRESIHFHDNLFNRHANGIISGVVPFNVKMDGNDKIEKRGSMKLLL